MALHWFSADRLSKRLAAGLVTPQEQSFYLSISFIVWLLPYYLFIVPPPNFQAWSFPLVLWFYEGGALIAIYGDEIWRNGSTMTPAQVADLEGRIRRHVAKAEELERKIADWDAVHSCAQ